MYIWKVNSLIEDLKENKVSQKEQFKYALTFTALTVLVTDPMLTVGLEYTSLDTISTLIMMVITIFGVILCYNVNEKTDSKDFILRYFTIGLPISVRFLAILLPLALVSGAIEVILDPDYDFESESYTTSIYQVLFISVAQIIFYFYYSSKFRLFAKTDNAEEIVNN